MSTGFVYICRREHSTSGLLKIGCSDSTPRRMSEFNRETGADSDMILEFVFACPLGQQERLERTAHRLGHAKRRRGEWFALSLVEAVALVQQAGRVSGVPCTAHYDRQQVEVAAAQVAANRAAVERSKAIAAQHAEFDRLAAKERTEAEQKLLWKAKEERRVDTRKDGAAIPWIAAIVVGWASTALGNHPNYLMSLVVAGIAYGVGVMIREGRCDTTADAVISVPLTPADEAKLRAADQNRRAAISA